MKTFDYEQVTAVMAPLKAKFENCAHCERTSCETLDQQLNCCADICFEMAAKLKSWARDVFAGEIILDPEAERVWRSEIRKILAQAVQLWQQGRKEEVPCYELPAQGKLASALWELNWLSEKWVTPKQSVSPAARVKFNLDDEQRRVIAIQINSLPVLPQNEKNLNP